MRCKCVTRPGFDANGVNLALNLSKNRPHHLFIISANNQNDAG